MAKYEKIPTLISNAEVEKKEWILNPNFRSFEVGGEYHSGTGTPVILPEGSKIFSRVIKLQPDLVANLVGKKKAMSPAEMAKMFPTMPYIKTLVNDDANDVEKKTAEIMLTKNLATQNSIFDAQEESKKSKSTKALDSLMQGLETFKMGGKFAFGDTYKLPSQNSLLSPMDDAKFNQYMSQIGSINNVSNQDGDTMTNQDNALSLANPSYNNSNNNYSNQMSSSEANVFDSVPTITKNNNSYLSSNPTALTNSIPNVVNSNTVKTNPYDVSNIAKSKMGHDPILAASQLNQAANILDLATLRQQPPSYNFQNQTTAYERYNPMNTLAAERQFNLSREELQNSNMPEQAKASYNSDILGKILDNQSQTAVQNQQGYLQNQNRNSELYNNTTNQNRQQKIAYDDRFEELRQKMLANKDQAQEKIMQNILGENSKMAQDKVNLSLVNKLGENFYYDGQNIKYLPGQPLKSTADPLAQYGDGIDKGHALREAYDAMRSATGKDKAPTIAAYADLIKAFSTK